MTRLRLTALIAALAGVLLAPFTAQAQDDLSAIPLDLLTTQAQAGNTAAQFEMGQRNDTGLGTLQNHRQAAEWYRQAASNGHAGAQNRLGQYYFTGLGLPQDPTASQHWLTAAAAQGHPEHIFDLASAVEASFGDASATPDLARAAALYEQAAQTGHIEAAVSLGVLYHHGQGVPQDLAKAHTLYEQGAAANDPRGMNNLGLLYVRGQGVPQDYERAAQLFSAAAERGLAQAIGNLGVLYANGFGVPQSDEKAAELYRRAARQNQQSQTDVDEGPIFDHRLAPPPTDEQARIALTGAARDGDPVAQFLMGWLLITTQDSRGAAKWFHAAAAKGHRPSMLNLGRLYKIGLGVPQDYVLAQMWLTLGGAADPALAAAMPVEQLNEAQTRAETLWIQLTQSRP